MVVMSRAGSWLRGCLAGATSSIAALLLLVGPIHGMATSLPLCCRVDARCQGGEHCPLRAAPRAGRVTCHDTAMDHATRRTAGGSATPASRAAHIGAPRPCASPCCTMVRTLPGRRQTTQLEGGNVPPSPADLAVPVIVRVHRATSILTVQSWRGPPSFDVTLQSTF